MLEYEQGQSCPKKYRERSRMKNTLKTALALVAVAGMMTTAYAQDKPTGVSVRAGIFLAAGNAKDAEGQNWFVGGLEYKLGDLKYDGSTNTSYSLSLDYYGKGSFSSAPLLMNYIWRTESFYYSVGAGVAFTHTAFGGKSDSAMEFGYALTLGKDFVRGGKPLFVEAKYFGNNRSELNGFALMGGIRF